MNDIIWGFALVFIVAWGFVLGNFLLAQILKYLNGRKRKAALVKLEEFKSLIEKRERDGYDHDEADTMPGGRVT